VGQRLVGIAFDGLVELPAEHGLQSVDAYITSQCNRQCTYCFLPSEFFSSGQRMSAEAFSDVIAWCLRHHVGEVTLLGGEPSLHPAFPEMVALAHGQGLTVRVVTNGARRFQRLIENGLIGRHNLSRVAVSLDTLDEVVQDTFRGRGAWQDAMDTIALLRDKDILFDINVTGVRPALDGIGALIHFADEARCRRVNVHWPSSIGLGAHLAADDIPGRDEWQDLVLMVTKRVETRPDFFVEIERGFLAESDPLVGCALDDFSNLQILPDGRAYRCGLLVDQAGMASLTMTGDQLRLTGPGFGEELLRSSTSPGCDACPAVQADGRWACIYDKVTSAPSG
jgi:MoaA/NifB/PqqE/SkfB family radical SAM enzyme